MAYYTLLTRERPGLNWHPQFGDHVRSVVEDERDLACESQMGPARKNTHILRTSSAHQHAIDAAIDALNGAGLHR